MSDDDLTPRMVARLKELEGKEPVYFEDELYSDDALICLEYRERVEAALKSARERHRS